MQKLLAYLQLCRFAAVFTAVADIFLGYLLTHSDLGPEHQFGLLVAASASLYLAGMVWNDVFDRTADSRERPKRPIPSGRVAVRAAVVFGGFLVIAGMALSCAVGSTSLVVASLLATSIFLYDGLLKTTAAGPIAMGACRFLNVILGCGAAALASGEPATAAVWSLPQIQVAAALGVYIAGVTWFARHEARTSPKASLALAMGIINLGLALLVVFVMNRTDPWDHRPRTLMALAVIVLVVNRRAVAALVDPVPAKVQAAIKTMLLSLIMLDASLVFFVQADSAYAIAVAMLLIPATLLGRYLAIT